MFSTELVTEFARQGAGFLIALIMFIVWLFEKKEQLKKANEREKKLTGILTDRKIDRDNLIELMARIETHFAMQNAFEKFARELLDNEERPNPRRRVLDKKLAEALANVEQGKR